ncbi:cytochrome P450 [Mycobacterium sp. PS03-16]|uniref:cytochrome P450 n=1 Tax=Mycobacterium sp. PS03-16 TaxID=2559611 RepID=UPI0010734567|nr:cytochrome P450 [Mycobacterium sp. PS03-16]TFV58419.1 cytochrome P450 [Mycobacterium sp. PS03-16]
MTHAAEVSAAGTARSLDELPPVPVNPLPFRRQLQAIRAFHTGVEQLRDAGGPVTRLKVGPRWLTPPVVVVTSPQGAHDVLTADRSATDRMRVHQEVRGVLGANLFVLPNEPWAPRRRLLQPLFTKKAVRVFGGHMAQAAEMVGGRWGDAALVDLDHESRLLTLRALGRSVLGEDLDAHADEVGEALRTALTYAADRGARPVRAPRWLPTPARRRARAASRTLHAMAAGPLRACRADDTRDAPLVRALLDATDPQTGRALTDDEIADELLVFMLAGHDTTATTLAYALWAMGRHRDMADRVRAEAAAVGDRELTPDDVPHLPYTVQVLHESLRLCPPASTTGRMVVRDIEVDGHRVEAGSIIVVGIYALHRDPALWDNPAEFDPDRFAPDRSAGRSRWQYLPFGAGARSCIGDHFAMLEATLALATLLRRYDIESLGEEFPMAVPFTTVAAEPVLGRVRLRST